MRKLRIKIISGIWLLVVGYIFYSPNFCFARRIKIIQETHFAGVDKIFSKVNTLTRYHNIPSQLNDVYQWLITQLREEGFGSVLDFLPMNNNFISLGIDDGQVSTDFEDYQDSRTGFKKGINIFARQPPGFARSISIAFVNKVGDNLKT